MKRSLDKFNEARVLVVGDVMLDRYWWGSVSRISPEAPVPVVRLERMTSTPGGAANVAANVRSMSGKVELIGVVADDEAGAGLRDELTRIGIAADSLSISGERRTNVKTRVVAHAQQVTRIDIEDTFPLTDREAESVLKNFRSSIDRNDVVIISDYAKGVLRTDLLAEMIAEARRLGKHILVDPKGKDFAKYNGATVLTPNRREAAEACKLDDHMPDIVSVAGRQLVSELDFESVVITESENGMTLFERDGRVVHYDAHTHEVYDVTGAGDSVIACMAVALGAGFAIDAASEIANIAGGLSVQQIGTSHVTLGMIRSELSKEGPLTEVTTAR